MSGIALEMKPRRTAFFPCCGAGGGAIGYQWDGYEVLGGIDNDQGACQDFENLSGVPAANLDLFSYDQWVVFHSQWKPVARPSVVKRLERYGKALDVVVPEFKPGLTRLRRSRYRKFAGSWWRCTKLVTPPEGWKEISLDDIIAASQNECPDLVFSSPPCKGFSALLPAKAAKSPPYQVLNELVPRTIILTLEAYLKKLGTKPKLLLLENVPGIVQRGPHLLKIVQSVLESYGYAWTHGYHDCGEIGHLAQSRKRYLLIARDPEQLASFVYEPDLFPLRAIGEEIGEEAAPNDVESCGPMHKLPKLSIVTWLRLALIPAGGDWRALEAACQRLEAGEIHIVKDRALGIYRIVEQADMVLMLADEPERYKCLTSHRKVVTKTLRFKSKARDGFMRVGSMSESSQTITGTASVSRSNGIGAVADDRTQHVLRGRTVVRLRDYWVESNTDDDERILAALNKVLMPAPRGGVRHDSKYKVQTLDAAARTVDGCKKGVGSGAACVADSRTQAGPGRFINVPRGQLNRKQPVGSDRSEGEIAVAQQRRNKARFKHSCRVVPWNTNAGTVTSGHSPSNGATTVADVQAAGIDPEPSRSGQASLFDLMDVEPQRYSTVDPLAFIQELRRLAVDVPIFISLDGTWHRPLTTYELALLQSFPRRMPNGDPLNFAGRSDGAKRERIGNAVPPKAARAMARIMSRCLELGQTMRFVFGEGRKVWVSPTGDITNRSNIHKFGAGDTVWINPNGEHVNGPLEPILDWPLTTEEEVAKQVA